MTLLIPLGAAGLVYVFPLTLSVIVLLAIVYFSYRQTIEAYPNGAGSYTVARENLGERFGLLAGTALVSLPSAQSARLGSNGTVDARWRRARRRH